MTKINETERKEQIELLQKWFPKGATVYTILRHVSKSGMQRQISVVCLTCENGKVVDLHPNYSIGRLLGYGQKTGWRDSLTVNGCGSDMGFEIAYNLGSALYSNGYALKHQWL